MKFCLKHISGMVTPHSLIMSSIPSSFMSVCKALQKHATVRSTVCAMTEEALSPTLTALHKQVFAS